jgi:ABC-type bacteriocin/lantibiotic exporter with double-glycine peptidase domain
VLILDEATTSFEQSLEESILRTSSAAIPPVSGFQVTHRFDSTRRADWIIGLENGRVTVSGSWEDMRTIPSLQA